jgi:hypothetical protein
MGKLLKKIQKNHALHSFLRKYYGKTLGFWWFKDWFVKNVGFYNGKERIRLVEGKRGELEISKGLRSGKPFLVARYGSTEFRTLFDKNHLESLCTYSGFFPFDKKLHKKFLKEYIDSSKSIDVLGVWNYQNNFLNKMKWVKKFSNIKCFVSLGQVDSLNSLWIKELEGKKVLVVHPFEATIKTQYKKRKQLETLPKLKSLQVVKAVQTIAGNKDPRFETWFDALDYMKGKINKKDFDIALIGCGAYGLPLAAHVKSLGKQAIHMGGGLQLLFGIKGKRWEKSGFFNDHWIYPLKEDIATNSKKIEGGCYWK